MHKQWEVIDCCLFFVKEQGILLLNYIFYYLLTIERKLTRIQKNFLDAGV